MKRVIYMAFIVLCLAYHVYAQDNNSKNADTGRNFPSKEIPRVMMTKCLPLFVVGNKTKSYIFKDHLKFHPNSKKLPYKLSLEMTTDPTWLAVNVLPYLIENKSNDCSEVFNCFFAYAMAKYILNQEPNIINVYKNNTVNNSNQNLSTYFNEDKINNELSDAINKLEQSQLPDGSWPWYPGMKGNRYITGLICAGIGRLEGMIAYNNYTDRLRTVGVKAFAYLDEQMYQDYELVINKKENIKDDLLTPDIIYYLYARTFWKVPISARDTKPFYFWLQQSFNHWRDKTLMEKAMLSSALYREDEQPKAFEIWGEIEQDALHSDDEAMYWKENKGGYGIFDQKAETQSMIIEAYCMFPPPQVRPDEDVKFWYAKQKHSNPKIFNEMKFWLLKQIHHGDWGSNMADADALYCMILSDKGLFTPVTKVEAKVGGYDFDLKKIADSEQIIGYINHEWKENEIKPDLAEIKIENKDSIPAWAMVYFKYLENRKTNAGSGDFPVIIKEEVYKLPIGGSATYSRLKRKDIINAGDSFKIVLHLSVKQNLLYIDINNNIGFPVLISQNLKDNSVNGINFYEGNNNSQIKYFFESLPKGNYLIQYSGKAQQAWIYKNAEISVNSAYK